MAKQNEKELDRCNMVWLAGVVENIKVRDDGSAFLLVNPEGETKFIPCTVYDDKALSRLLSGFDKGDVIKVRGFVRAWSQKKDGEWKNNVEVRITEVKNRPPERRQQRTAASADAGDDIPF